MSAFIFKLLTVDISSLLSTYFFNFTPFGYFPSKYRFHRSKRYWTSNTLIALILYLYLDLTFAHLPPCERKLSQDSLLATPSPSSPSTLSLPSAANVNHCLRSREQECWHRVSSQRGLNFHFINKIWKQEKCIKYRCSSWFLFNIFTPYRKLPCSK